MELFLLSNGKMAQDEPQLRYFSARQQVFKLFHDGFDPREHYDTQALQPQVPFHCG